MATMAPEQLQEMMANMNNMMTQMAQMFQQNTAVGPTFAPPGFGQQGGNSKLLAKFFKRNMFDD